jgi:hypothetical protein
VRTRVHSLTHVACLPRRDLSALGAAAPAKPDHRRISSNKG